MDKDKGRLDQPTNASVLLTLILAMSFGMLVYSLATHEHLLVPEPPQEETVPMDEAEIRFQAAVKAHKVDAGSRVSPVQTHLAHILKTLPRDLPWYKAAQSVIDQSAELLKINAPAPSDEVTLVTVALTLGPNAPDFEISNPESVKNNFLKFKHKKIVFADEESAAVFAESMDDSTKLVLITLDHIKRHLGPAYEDIVTISKRRNWRNSVHWLKGAAQANHPDYDAVSASKIFLLREAARLNPWNTKSFMWMDSSLSCASPSRLLPTSMGFFNKRFDRFFLSFFDYTAETETHGFPRHAWNYFSGATDLHTTKHKVAKGWAFGGQLAHIEVIALVFEIMLRETLREGHMGNGDCVISLALTRFPSLFHPFALSTACKTSTNDDMSCPDQRSSGDWCAPFVWALE